MTVERKRTLTVDDIIAFEIGCANCGTVLSIPLERCNKTASQCPRCGASWYAGGAAENDAIIELASAIAEIKTQSKPKVKPKFKFRIEIQDEATQ
jgi:uncharacterized paraquat-inducible protein A